MCGFRVRAVLRKEMPKRYVSIEAKGVDDVDAIFETVCREAFLLLMPGPSLEEPKNRSETSASF
jgi:hypothetical protein